MVVHVPVRDPGREEGAGESIGARFVLIHSPSDHETLAECTMGLGHCGGSNPRRVFQNGLGPRGRTDDGVWVVHMVWYMAYADG